MEASASQPARGAGQTRRVLGVFTIATITVALVTSTRGVPTMAEYGLASIFFYVLVAATFLIPVALVSAELATGWPREGGVYVWVEEAFGERLGFVAIWLQWIENVIWYPTVLSFTAAAAAYIFNPSLAGNNYYMAIVVVGVFWGATLVNFRGMKLSGLISTVGVIAGTALPGVILIVMGALWLISGEESQVSFTGDALLPDFTSLGTLVFAASAFLLFAGIEAVAAHAEDVKNPGRDYPKAIFLSVVFILVLFIPTTLAVAIVLPTHELSIVSGIMQAFKVFFDSFHIGWAVPIIATLTAVGAIGQISSWVVAPSRGLAVAARKGTLPPVFQRANDAGIPVGVLVAQACLVTVESLLFVLLPSVQSVYWVLTALTTQLYLAMYVLMYAAAIKLRTSQPDVHRPYRLPGGKRAMNIVAGLGIFFAAIVIAIGFFPPSQLKAGSPLGFEIAMVGGFLFFVALPAAIFHFKRPSWKPVHASTQERSSQQGASPE